jgi:hypothetical protein
MEKGVSTERRPADAINDAEPATRAGVRCLTNVYLAVPVGLPEEWTLVTLAAVATALAALLYSILWRIRFGRGETSLDASLRRLRGRVEGQGPAGRPALIRERSGALWKLPRVEVSDRRGQRWRLEVVASTVLRWPRRARYQRRLVRWLAVGDPVTLEGHEVLGALGESTYRAPAAEARLEVTRITRGAWPRVPGLMLATLVSSVLAIAGCMLLAFGERYEPLLIDRGVSFRVEVQEPVEPALRVLRPGMLVSTCNCVMTIAVPAAPACCHRSLRITPRADRPRRACGRGR